MLKSTFTTHTDGISVTDTTVEGRGEEEENLWIHIGREWLH